VENYQKYLDPQTLAKLAGLDLKARLIIEGYIAGLHKSPYHGFSIEFAQHREYSPGDDIRHVDWKVYGRTDKYYLKQYEEETNLVAYLLVDSSESMQYRSGATSKYEYACYVAASLAHLIIRQQDSAGLVLFDEQVRRFVRASSQPSHLKALLHELEQAQPRAKTRVAPIFNDLAERLRKRSLVIVISDQFDDPESIIQGLRHFRHRRHELIVFHVLDRAELEFPFQQTTLFRGLEGWPDTLSEPRALRRAYLAEVQAFVNRIKKGCRLHNIDYVGLHTEMPLDVALSSYLAGRMVRLK